MFTRFVLFFAAAVWLYYIGVRSCLNYVEFGAIARCVVVSVVPWCSLSLSLSLSLTPWCLLYCGRACVTVICFAVAVLRC